MIPHSLQKSYWVPRVEKQTDFHATLWEATVAKQHVALYIDRMMDESTSNSFRFSSYLQQSFI